jgi:hypothetical protein
MLTAFPALRRSGGVDERRMNIHVRRAVRPILAA